MPNKKPKSFKDLELELREVRSSEKEYREMLHRKSDEYKQLEKVQRLMAKRLDLLSRIARIELRIQGLGFEVPKPKDLGKSV